VAGWTGSDDFPTTPGAYDRSHNGDWDAFISKLNSDLTKLLASTFLGGSNGEGAYAIAIDSSGNVYVTGNTSSSDFPTTPGAYDTSYNDDVDVFVSKLDANLTKLLASTFLGGGDGDDANAIAIDSSGNVYVVGKTWSTDFPTTIGAYDTSFKGGDDFHFSDAFISKLNSNLTQLLASTYLGGSSADIANALAIDSSGNVYVAGWTNSKNFPTTSRAYDRRRDGSEVFISKFDANLSK
jgi:hypothetical protein